MWRTALAAAVGCALLWCPTMDRASGRDPVGAPYPDRYLIALEIAPQVDDEVAGQYLLVWLDPRSGRTTTRRLPVAYLGDPGRSQVLTVDAGRRYALPTVAVSLGGVYDHLDVVDLADGKLLRLSTLRLFGVRDPGLDAAGFDPRRPGRLLLVNLAGKAWALDVPTQRLTGLRSVSGDATFHGIDPDDGRPIARQSESDAGRKPVRLPGGWSWPIPPRKPPSSCEWGVAARRHGERSLLFCFDQKHHRFTALRLSADGKRWARYGVRSRSVGNVYPQGTGFAIPPLSD